MKLLNYNEVWHRNANSYFWLLIFFALLLFFPIFSVFLKGRTHLMFQISASIIIVWGAFVVTDNKKELYTGSVLALLALLGLWINSPNIQPDKNLTIFQSITNIPYFIYLGKRLVIQLFENNQQVDLNLIYGAIIIFLTIGIIGGELCILLDLLQPETFFKREDQIDTYNYYYFSFITLSTIGYGDITPNNEAGRALALFIGLSGQIYLTIAMAIIIGKYLNSEQNRQD